MSTANQFYQNHEINFVEISQMENFNFYSKNFLSNFSNVQTSHKLQVMRHMIILSHLHLIKKTQSSLKFSEV